MAKKYCNRCTYDMWYSEEKKRWYCSNEKCVKYKEQPQSETATASDGDKQEETK